MTILVKSGTRLPTPFSKPHLKNWSDPITLTIYSHCAYPLSQIYVLRLFAFFRNEKPVTLLRSLRVVCMRVLLIYQSCSAGDEQSFWSAGCSTVYTSSRPEPLHQRSLALAEESPSKLVMLVHGKHCT